MKLRGDVPNKSEGGPTNVVSELKADHEFCFGGEGKPYLLQRMMSLPNVKKMDKISTSGFRV
jgi:hypothetical protein